MGEKLNNNPQWSRYDPLRGIDITGPRHLRITPYGAVRKTYYEVDWSDRDLFWLIIDLITGKRYYLPTINACLKLEIYGRDDNTLPVLKMLTKKKMIFRDRYLVERISKLHYIYNGGNPKKVCWKYKEEVEDKNERLEQIRSNHYRPVPLAKYEDRAF